MDFNIRNKLSINLVKYKRILSYLENFETGVKIKSKRDLELIDEIKKQMDIKIKKIRRLLKIEFVLYFGVYFSFITLFFPNMFFLLALSELISNIISLFGTTVFLIAIFFLNKLKELYYQDLNLLSSHLISIYETSDFKRERLFEDNHFNNFIKFFKNRGF